MKNGPRALSATWILTVLCGLLGAGALHARPLTVVASSGAIAAPSAAAGAVGDLTLRYPLSDTWGLALGGRSGWLHSGLGCAGGPCTDQLQLALLVGPAWHLPWRNSHLYLSAQIAHVHHAAVRAWKQRPAANLAGDSSGDVQHRSGGELSAAMTWPPFWSGDKWALAIETAVLGGVLPSSPQLAWSAGLKVGIALVEGDGAQRGGGRVAVR